MNPLYVDTPASALAAPTGPAWGAHTLTERLNKGEAPPRGLHRLPQEQEAPRG